jgi:hypothetical protein
MKPLMGFDGKPFVPKGEFCLAYASMPEIKKFLTHYAHN